jgi:hypothetical protein
MKRWNHMGKLGTGVPDATAVMAELADDGSTANGPGDLPDWDAIDWRRQEEQVRRLQQRIFKAEQEGNRKQVRNLQKLPAPRGALLYPRLSREEFEGRFLGLMPYLELKGEGDRSMAGN